MKIGGSTGVLDHLSIAQKIIALFVVNVIVAISISAISVLYLDEISHELDQVANEDIPLTRHLSAINSQQLEQAIHLERAIRYGELLSLGQNTATDLDKEISYFNDLAHTVEEALADVRALLSTLLKKDHEVSVQKELQTVLI